MARTVQDAKLGSRTARSNLAVSGKPYYKELDPKLHLGYRKGKTGGKWVARHYIGNGVYKVETLDGVADDKADADGIAALSFAQAQALARKKHLELITAATAPPESERPYTVAVCIEEYLAWLENNRKSADDARYRAEALILPSLGPIACADLTKDTLLRWRDAVARSAPRLRTRKCKAQKYREIGDGDEARRRRRASANRVLTILKAALNRAWRDGKIVDDRAWRQIEPFEGVDAARVRYLSIDACRRLINAARVYEDQEDGTTPRAKDEFRLLVRAALLTGARFGELANLCVEDFNRDVGTLRIRTSKSGRARHIVLTEEGANLFETLTTGRHGAELMLRKADGSRWRKSHQTRPMKKACERAGIEPPADFHCLRHSYASHTVMAGAPLLVVAKNLGHSDTRMVEKHYGHLAPSYIADQIRAAAPRFGFPEDDSNVTALRGAR
jgi:integrase